MRYKRKPGTSCNIPQPTEISIVVCVTVLHEPLGVAVTVTVYAPVSGLKYSRSFAVSDKVFEEFAVASDTASVVPLTNAISSISAIVT
jgi:hypothetical protein